MKSGLLGEAHEYWLPRHVLLKMPLFIGLQADCLRRNSAIDRDAKRQRYSSPSDFRLFSGDHVRFVQSFITRPVAAALLAVMGLLATPAIGADRAEQVLCHYTYGGETRALVALPASSPYAVKAIDVGSFFHFRVVFQSKPADIAAIKIYTYADRDDGPILIHQATFPYPPAGRRGAPYGFSGLHSVHEPVRDGELQYWCQLTSAEHAGRKVTQ